jgi:hypothetical protein
VQKARQIACTFLSIFWERTKQSNSTMKMRDSSPLCWPIKLVHGVLVWLGFVFCRKNEIMKEERAADPVLPRIRTLALPPRCWPA